jgi:hypothetical protein
MDTATEIEYEKRELNRRYTQVRNSLIIAADQLKKLEEEFGFEYQDTITELKNVREQLRTDQQMATEMIEFMAEDFEADHTPAAN